MPEFFGRRSKLMQLVRLIPYCERNYNLIELGPKGAGKSHIYSEFSPHGILISGGEVTVAKLFVNNANGRIGLVGFWDAVAFDIPGWEVDIIRGEMFSVGCGFVVDYLAEILRNMRSHDYSQFYRNYFEMSADISTCDRTSIENTFSGLVKVLYPHGELFRDEAEELLRFAIEGRKRVKDQRDHCAAEGGRR